MDPLSIVTSVASIVVVVSRVSVGLYSFVHETRNVDRTVKDLVAEVDSLKTALLDVDSVLKSPAIVAAEKRLPTADDNKQLWQSLYGSLEDCEVTVVRIDSALDVVRKRRSRFFTQAVRQVKINLGKDEINMLRTQVHTHCSALKMALQMVTIRAAYLAPGVIIGDLGARIDSLQDSMGSLTTSLAEQRRENARMSRPRTGGELRNTDGLRAIANQILAAASTVHGSTVAGVSVLGDPVDEAVRLRTMDWIPAPIINDLTSSTSSLTRPRQDGILSSEPDGAADTQPTTDPGVDGSDSEEELDFEVSQRLLDKGTESFLAGNHNDAAAHFQMGVANSNRLSRRRRMRLGLEEVPFMIATCKYRLNRLDQAEADLLVLVRQESTSEADAVRVCQLSHLLSQIYLDKNKLELSEEQCRQSLKGRRRLLGREHPDYFASLGLLAQLCQLREKHEEAGVYRDMIPFDLLPSEIPKPRNEVPQTDHSLLATLEGPKELIGNVMYSPDGNFLAIVSWGSTLTLWNLKTQQNQTLNKGLENFLTTLVFTRDSMFVAATRGDGSAYMWAVATGKEHRRIVPSLTGLKPQSVRLSPDCKWVAHGMSSGKLFLWDVEKEKLSLTLNAHSNAVCSVSFSRHANLVATGSNSNDVKLWDVATGRLSATLGGLLGSTSQIAFSQDDRLVAARSSYGGGKVWEVATGKILVTLEETPDLFSFHPRGGDLRLSPDGELVATAFNDRTAVLWETSTGQRRKVLEGHEGVIERLVFSSNGIFVATQSMDKTVRVWDVVKGLERIKFASHGADVCTVAFSPHGTQVATGYADGTTRLWRIDADLQLGLLHSRLWRTDGSSSVPTLERLASPRPEISPPGEARTNK